MIDRRQFLQILSGAVAAIATVANATPEAPAIEYTHADSPRFANHDGIEIMEGTQPIDADYLQVTVVKWKSERPIACRTVRFYVSRGIPRSKDVETLIQQAVDEIQEITV